MPDTHDEKRAGIGILPLFWSFIMDHCHSAVPDGFNLPRRPRG
ncbi:hypothetical protein HMPREF3038_02719 [Akkermansia sp. KLE1797]|nr:hypothetical protein HMPREF3038_02719 [Akkermansia sp. KLE1797]KXU53176.1 hypothetical protein HMPREF3039_02732 [Akkermansia sp. KLE1798]KZA03815.1 hypothetical protein HMPREF1326_02588 [Akkermansia sp. KLE1605]